MTRTYLVESFWPGVTEAAYTDGTARAAAAARDLRTTGRDIEFLGSMLIPSDEVAFWRFASESRTGVEETSAHAGLTYDRILECLELPADAARATP